MRFAISAPAHRLVLGRRSLPRPERVLHALVVDGQGDHQRVVAHGHAVDEARQQGELTEVLGEQLGELFLGALDDAA